MGKGRERKSSPRAVRIRRAYEPAARGDGYRVLVDRLWPRGVSRAKLEVDAWLKELAPSDALRRWFGHDPARWGEFVLRYRRELRARPAARRTLAELARRAREESVTLVFGARDEQHSNALVLAREIERRTRAAARRRAVGGH